MDFVPGIYCAGRGIDLRCAGHDPTGTVGRGRFRKSQASQLNRGFDSPGNLAGDFGLAVRALALSVSLGRSSDILWRDLRRSESSNSCSHLGGNRTRHRRRHLSYQCSHDEKAARADWGTRHSASRLCCRHRHHSRVRD